MKQIVDPADILPPLPPYSSYVPDPADPMMKTKRICITLDASKARFLEIEGRRNKTGTAPAAAVAIGFAIAHWQDAMDESFSDTGFVRDCRAYTLTLDPETSAAIDALVANHPGVTASSVIASQFALFMRDMVNESRAGDETLAQQAIEEAASYRPMRSERGRTVTL